MTSSGRKTNQLAAMSDTAGALIQMRRSGCPPERCPAYSVSIFIDGTVSYDGRENVGVVGKRYAKLAGERVSELMSAIDAMGFLDIPERCCLCPTAPGSQMVILDYRPGSAQKTVIHEEGCSSAPAAVIALEQAIDRASGVERWIAPAVTTAAVAPATVPQ
jgi:hypothetical protein